MNDGSAETEKTMTMLTEVPTTPVLNMQNIEGRLNSTVQTTGEQVKRFNREHVLRERIEDGFKSAGRFIDFDEKNNPVSSKTGEQITPDRAIFTVDTSSPYLKQLIDRAQEIKAYSTTEEDAIRLITDYISKNLGPFDIGSARGNFEGVHATFKGQEIDLGKILEEKLPVNCEIGSLIKAVVLQRAGFKDVSLALRRGYLVREMSNGLKRVKAHEWVEVTTSGKTLILENGPKGTLVDGENDLSGYRLISNPNEKIYPGRQEKEENFVDTRYQDEKISENGQDFIVLSGPDNQKIKIPVPEGITAIDDSAELLYQAPDYEVRKAQGEFTIQTFAGKDWQYVIETDPKTGDQVCAYRIKGVHEEATLSLRLLPEGLVSWADVQNEVRRLLRTQEQSPSQQAERVLGDLQMDIDAYQLPGITTAQREELFKEVKARMNLVSIDTAVVLGNYEEIGKKITDDEDLKYLWGEYEHRAELKQVVIEMGKPDAGGNKGAYFRGDATAIANVATKVAGLSLEKQKEVIEMAKRLYNITLKSAEFFGPVYMDLKTKSPALIGGSIKLISQDLKAQVDASFGIGGRRTKDNKAEWDRRYFDAFAKVRREAEGQGVVLDDLHKKSNNTQGVLYMPEVMAAIGVKANTLRHAAETYLHSLVTEANFDTLEDFMDALIAPPPPPGIPVTRPPANAVDITRWHESVAGAGKDFFPAIRSVLTVPLSRGEKPTENLENALKGIQYIKNTRLREWAVSRLVYYVLDYEKNRNREARTEFKDTLPTLDLDTRNNIINALKRDKRITEEDANLALKQLDAQNWRVQTRKSGRAFIGWFGDILKAFFKQVTAK